MKENSNKRVWWKCDKGHESEATISSLTRGSRCPYCSGNKLLKGYNDLATINPNLAKEWNYKKNGDITPNDVTSCCGKKVWWKCNKGHEWEAKISNRAILKRGCPYCSNQKVLVGYNDLASNCPSILSEWNYKKNKDILPTDITLYSNKKVWWKCSKCGNEYQNYICSKTRGTGCPKCHYNPLNVKKK